MRIKLFILLLLVSCHTRQRDAYSIAEPESIADSDTWQSMQNRDKAKAKAVAQSGINVQHLNQIHTATISETDSLVLNAHIDSIGASVVCYLPVSKAGTLNAWLEPETSRANIRFNQIIFPDDQADGPFGQELIYTLKEKGIYRLVIGPSLMAENPYVGNFKIHLVFKDTVK